MPWWWWSEGSRNVAVVCGARKAPSRGGAGRTGRTRETRASDRWRAGDCLRVGRNSGDLGLVRRCEKERGTLGCLLVPAGGVSPLVGARLDRGLALHVPWPTWLLVPLVIRVYSRIVVAYVYLPVLCIGSSVLSGQPDTIFSHQNMLNCARHILHFY